MTEENFSTTANDEPEELKKKVQDGVPQVLKLINQNRKEGLKNLQRRLDSLQGTLDEVQAWTRKHNGPLFLIHGDNNSVLFSMENELRNLKSALDAVLTTNEAQDSLLDMLVNDLV